ncbi:MAG TPA: hypothetical protein VFM14_07100 [Gemmatimonadales bacterium]|nr:hypothetical protein [Gemmatimonadales bacterium]
MPIALQVLVSLRPAQQEQFQRALLDAGLVDQLVAPLDLRVPIQQIDIPSEDAMFALATAMRLHDLQPGRTRRYWNPTPKELAACELLVMYPWIHSTGVARPRPEREYDRGGACPACGAGLRPLGPLRLRKGEIPKKGWLGTVSRDLLLVHDDLRSALEAESISGITFERALDRQGAALPWHEVRIDVTMPAMALGTTGIVRGRISGEAPCARCGRDGWFDDPEQAFTPVYASAVLDTAADIAATHERFGTGELRTPLTESDLAGHRLIARRRVYQLCRRLKLRGIRFSPVWLT